MGHGIDSLAIRPFEGSRGFILKMPTFAYVEPVGAWAYRTVRGAASAIRPPCANQALSSYTM